MLTVYNPKGFLVLAKRLLKDENYKMLGRTRTAIGRAYYAAFLASKAKQESRGHRFPDDHTVHRAVIESFIDDSLSHIANKLDELRDFRSDADYHMNTPLVLAEGNKCLELAEDVFHALESL